LVAADTGAALATLAGTMAVPTARLLRNRAAKAEMRLVLTFI
jgi:hypothetical protein